MLGDFLPGRWVALLKEGVSEDSTWMRCYSPFLEDLALSIQRRWPDHMSGSSMSVQRLWQLTIAVDRREHIECVIMYLD